MLMLMLMLVLMLVIELEVRDHRSEIRGIERCADAMNQVR
jgi:hypothetical protein